jgi:hypothetical protein
MCFSAQHLALRLSRIDNYVATMATLNEKRSRRDLTSHPWQYGSDGLTGECSEVP